MTLKSNRPTTFSIFYLSSISTSNTVTTLVGHFHCHYITYTFISRYIYREEKIIGGFIVKSFSIPSTRQGETSPKFMMGWKLVDDIIESYWYSSTFTPPFLIMSRLGQKHFLQDFFNSIIIYIYIFALNHKVSNPVCFD